MQPGPGEPPAQAWRPLPLVALADRLAARPPTGRWVIAIAGRSGGGKSTLAQRLAALVPRSAVVGTDDLAWHEPMFAWAEAAAAEVLQPFRAGRPVHFRPPAWVARDRPGEITVGTEVEVLFFEGVGANRRELVDLIDVAVWVQSDVAEAERLGLARDIADGVNGDEAESIRFWHRWMDQEDEFHLADRPWERADVVVAGTGGASEPDQVLVGDAERRSWRV